MLTRMRSAFLLALCFVATVSWGQATVLRFDLPSQPLAAALQALGSQSRTNVLFDPPLVEGRDAPALQAELTLDQAFARLLAGTGLQHRFLDDKSVIVTAAAEPTTHVPAASKIRLAQAENIKSQNSSSADSADVLLQEVLVTATRRTETLSRVPLSIVATTQEILDKQGVRTIEDLTRVTPSVTFTPDAHLPGLTNITIRGIQSTSGVPTTGIYIDDTPVQVRRGQSPVRSNPYPQIFDLERVEVLRGPQGTLFGTGSVGGAIRFITPEPSLNNSTFYSRAELATTRNGAESYEAGLAGGAPIIEDKLGFRASAWHRHEGGYIDRLSRVTGERVEKDMDFSDAYTARVALGWRPTDRLTITPSVFFQDTSESDLGIYEVDVSRPSRGDLRNGVTKLPQTYDDRWYLPALKASLDFGNVTLFSNSSYFSRKSSSVSDDVVTDIATFAGYVGPLPAQFDNDPARTLAWARQHLFTQELRLQNNDPAARLNWVVGVFYSRSRIRELGDAQAPWLLEELNFGQRQAGLPEFESVSEAFGAELYNGISGSISLPRIEEVERSVFAQLDYRLTDRLKLTAGARYSESRFTVDQFDGGAWTGIEGGFTTHLESTVKPFTPKIGLSFEATPADLLYVNVAKGARAGDVSTAVGLTCSDDAATLGIDPLANQAVDSDNVWSYEVGTKNRLFGDRLTIDASAYRIDWKNVQTTLRLLCGIYTTLNFGDARSEGVDIALGAAPFDGLQLGASISYTDARYTTDIPGSDGSVIRRQGEPFNLAPWAVYLNGEYEFAMDTHRAYVRADFAYTSHDDTPLDTESPLIDPGIPRPAATRNLDLRTGLRMNDLDVSLFVSNVMNDHPELARFHDVPGTGAFRAITTRPRTIGLTVSIRR